MSNRREHWQKIFETNRPDEVSWFQPEARLSLELIESLAPDRAAAIIDVGGGASTLVDGLLAAGYQRLTVLDISGAALAQTRERLGEKSGSVQWIEKDILEAEIEDGSIDLWHDRAVFHFLTMAEDRRRYVEQVRRAMRRGGHLIVATFADDGPMRCSGLEVVRYSPEALLAEFGVDFSVVRTIREDHVTPSGSHQSFVYCAAQYEPAN